MAELISYSKNFLKIYFWQGISFSLGFLSMFIVIPALSKDKPVYGVYIICVSLMIFLSYADIGFLGAGQKFAAESFIKKDREAELEYIGFTAFILLLFLGLLSVLFFLLSFHPQFIVDNLIDSKKIDIASSLLLILAIFTPMYVIERIIRVIYIIRVENYIYQKINILASILKILSVFWFFREGVYNIVGYFLFFQIVNVLSSLTTLLVAKRKYDYNISLLIKKVKYNKKVFYKMKPLAFSLFFSIISWILYYELDIISIGKLLGPNAVAVYSIGFTLLTFIRSILGIIFSPFSARFNHLEGKRDEKGLKSLINKVFFLYTPLIIIPLLLVSFLSKPLVFSWVGVKYKDSVPIAQFLVLCNLFASVNYPMGMFLAVKQKLKDMYIINFIIPIVFWGGIYLTISHFKELSFAIFKFIAFMIITFMYFRIAIKYLQISLWKFFKEYLFTTFLSSFIVITLSYFLRNHLPIEKNSLNLLIVLSSIVFLSGLGFIIQYLISYKTRNNVKTIVNIILNNKN